MEGINKNKEQKDDALTAAYMLGRYDGRKEAEANVVRLTKERDWLADKCAMHCHDKDRYDILCSYDSCDTSILTCFGASGCDWVEAASRVRAAGEGICQK